MTTSALSTGHCPVIPQVEQQHTGFPVNVDWFKAVKRWKNVMPAGLPANKFDHGAGESIRKVSRFSPT